MVRFGVHTGLQHTTVDELRALWRTVEDHGYDWISIWDHFYAADFSGDPMCLEAVSMHTALALTTQRVRCGSLVYSIGYRHPAVIAKAISAIDLLSGGRATLGLGAGWFEGEYRAYGMPFPSAPERLRQLREAIQCVTRLLRDDTVDFAGDYFSLQDARCEPKPAQARLPVWVGGGGERMTLRIAAEHADGWNVPFVGVEEFAHKREVLEQHCERAGRDPDTIERGVNVPLAWDERALAASFGPLATYVRPSALTGSTQQVIDKVGAFRDAGAQWVIIAVRAPVDVEGLVRFASEVIPAMR
jgi:F420-dependent oxidoreductase-like protein